MANCGQPSFYSGKVDMASDYLMTNRRFKPSQAVGNITQPTYQDISGFYSNILLNFCDFLLLN